jgi:hypothetical protein
MGNCRSLYKQVSTDYTIFLKNRFGGIIYITANTNDSVYIIKQKLLKQLNYKFMEETNIRLFYNGLQLNNADLLKTHNITQEMSLHYSITIDPVETNLYSQPEF